MPLIQLTTSAVLSAPQEKELLQALSILVAEAIGKPEQYVMAIVSPGTMMMSGKAEEAAFADVRSIGGLTAQVNQEISRRLCALLTRLLGIAPDRVYLNFTEVSAHHWGWRGDRKSVV
jgi:phenylpyruvate tautomerase